MGKLAHWFLIRRDITISSPGGPGCAVFELGPTERHLGFQEEAAIAGYPSCSVLLKWVCWPDLQFDIRSSY